jgi:multiple sugar transport system substrate-binding protein
LDIRALYYNASLLKQLGLSVPRTIADLDHIANQLVERAASSGPERTQVRYRRIGFLPNPRNLWSWGVVFGGDFFDEQRFQATADDPAIVAALEWMTSYGRRFGTSAAAFRQRDQSLPGKPFALLTDRYALIVDGQWRCRDIARAQKQQAATGVPVIEYGVCPLPHPQGGRPNAGWINGNFFVIPHGARNPAGAWEFMKYWSGFGGREAEAAKTCVSGYWIPVSQAVVEQAAFQRFLQEDRLFSELVRLAASPNQVPRPNVPAALFYDRELIHAASEAIFRGAERKSVEVLTSVRRRMVQQLSVQRSAWNRFLQQIRSGADSQKVLP